MLDFAKGLAWGFVLCALITLIWGCRTKYVPVETVKTEYIRSDAMDSVSINRLQHIIDSFMERVAVSRVDCFLIVQDTAGNVKYHGEWHRNDRSADTYHNAVRSDSVEYYRNLYYALQRQKTDSTTVYIPISQKHTWWERVKIEYGGYAIGFLTFGMVIVIWIIKERRK